jgi:hypothetical protein
MRQLSFFLVGLMTLPTIVMAQQPGGPAPFAFGNANSWNATTNTNIPGDEHGGIGRTYIVLKANDEISFIKRPIAGGNNALPTGMPILDTTFFAPAMVGTSVIVPGGSSPTGLVRVAPNGDGRVIYDPYSPCGDGVGRWVVVEMADLTQATGTTNAAIIVGVSNGEDPNPTDPGVIWTQFAIASTAPANSGSDITAAADFPQVAFNTNWITVTANSFFVNPSTGLYTVPLVFVFDRQPTECNQTIPSSPSVLPVQSGSGVTCSGSSGGSSSSWYCDDTTGELLGACPAVSYHTAASDPDGSNQFFIRSLFGNPPKLNGYEITGTASSPQYIGRYAQYEVNGGLNGVTSWDSLLPATLPQAGTSMQVALGPDDDRIVSCVVRNHTLYAAHTIGLPATNPDSTAAQWWMLGLNSGTGTLYDVERIGGDGANGGSTYNSFDPAIAVNAAGDVLVGFSGLPNRTTAGSLGYLSALYAFESHSGCSEYRNFLYAQGAGPYYPNGDANGNAVRTGDYGQTIVDPMDDASFLTTAGYAGASGASGGGFGWTQAWAYVPPITPDPPQYITFMGTEDEGADNPMSITLTAPSGAQKGDVFFAQVDTGSYVSGVPANWIDFGAVSVSDPGFCNVAYQGHMYMHVYQGAGGDPGSYTFTSPASTATCGTLTVGSEFGGYLISYRGACINPWRLPSAYTVQAYPQSEDISTITVGPITPPGQQVGGHPYDNMTLFNYLLGSAETDDSTTSCSTMSPITGTPLPVTRFSVSGCGASAILPVIAGDNSPVSHTTTYGPYSSSDGLNAPKLGYQVLLPPY